MEAITTRKKEHRKELVVLKKRKTYRENKKRTSKIPKVNERA
jgi:hypothetical protein